MNKEGNRKEEEKIMTEEEEKVGKGKETVEEERGMQYKMNN